MIKGFAQRRIDRNAWEIALIDRERLKAITLEFRVHEYKENQIAETSFIDFDQLEIIKALSEALTEMGMLPTDGTTAELKATKYHLEDMRKLVFK